MRANFKAKLYAYTPLQNIFLKNFDSKCNDLVRADLDM